MQSLGVYSLPGTQSIMENSLRLFRQFYSLDGQIRYMDDEAMLQELVFMVASNATNFLGLFVYHHEGAAVQAA